MMPLPTAPDAPVRERLAFDSCWRFHLGDTSMLEIKGPSDMQWNTGRSFTKTPFQVRHVIQLLDPLS
jgi:hypothetical protein